MYCTAMVSMRIVRWPVLVLLVLACAGLASALVGNPWQADVLRVDAGSLGTVVVGFHLGVIQAVLLCLVAGVGTVATFYSARNLVGQHGLRRYALLELTVILALAVAVTTTSLPLLAAAWTTASFAIAGLVAHAGSDSALLAGRQVRARLLVGDALLWCCVLVLGIWQGAWSLDVLPATVATAPTGVVTAAALLLVGAGIVRSALVPAHRWLPETAEAPSPVSALLHAGLVNGVGVLALLMWPLIEATTLARLVLVVIGAATAIIATAQVRTRADVKGRLAASTSSQMGYLAVEVGLGLPAAALAHIVGHGVWKATQFLGAGDAIARARRSDKGIAARGSLRMVLGCGALAAGVVLVGASLPMFGWAPLLAPADLLPLIVAVGVTWLALVVILRSPVGGRARAAAAGVILAGALGYVLALRALAHVLVPAVGEPAPWTTPQGQLAALAVAALLVTVFVATWIDRRARSGDAPALARSVGRAALRPWTIRERLRRSPQVALALPPVTREDAALAEQHVNVAYASIGALYPLTSFVASNPLGGLEDLGFADAGHVAAELWGARPGPDASALLRALADGRVTPEDIDVTLDEVIPVNPGQSRLSGAAAWDVRWCLRRLLVDDDIPQTHVVAAATALQRAGVLTGRRVRTPIEALGAGSWLDTRVDAVAHHCCARSLAGTGWPGAVDPWSELRASAVMLDGVLGVRGAADVLGALPVDAAEATAALLEQLGIEPRDRPAVIGRLLARNPGWAAHLMWRVRHARLGAEAGLPPAAGPDPESLLVDLVATRLALEVITAEAYAPSVLGRPMRTEDLVSPDACEDLAQLLAAVWSDRTAFDALGVDEVRALADLLAPFANGGIARIRTQVIERAYRAPLLSLVRSRAEALAGSDLSVNSHVPAQPAGQVVMCIDVRSERVRRHLEGVGPWETFGAAGFFGIPLSYGSSRGTTSERSPALLRPTVQVTEHPVPAAGIEGTADAVARSVRAVEAAPGLVFGWAEAIGWLLAPVTLARTLAPVLSRRAAEAVRSPLVEPTQGRLEIDAELRQLADAAAAFLVTSGLRQFAPVVVLCGHGATVTNNPHVAAYDCGACGGSAGDVSARTLAHVLNDPGVRALLRDDGIEIPLETLFVAALHDTTTDVIRLLDSEPTTAAHAGTLALLLNDAIRAGEAVRAERLALLPDAPGQAPGAPHHVDVNRRAADWAQPRPEWGLAGAAAIVVGPRALTEGLDLKGRVFLQSYRADQDADGTALEQLLAAPVVVAQWITSQYWASTIDPSRYGAGDKTTHNVLGDGDAVSAVVTGARGDLRIGLPWQAVSPIAPSPTSRIDHDPWGAPTQHQPQRLLVLVHADTLIIDAVMRRQPSVRRLVTGEWVMLCAIDPDDGTIRRCLSPGEWVVEHPVGAAAASVRRRAS